MKFLKGIRENTVLRRGRNISAPWNNVSLKMGKRTTIVKSTTFATLWIQINRKISILFERAHFGLPRSRNGHGDGVDGLGGSHVSNDDDVQFGTHYSHFRIGVDFRETKKTTWILEAKTGKKNKGYKIHQI